MTIDPQLLDTLKQFEPTADAPVKPLDIPEMRALNTAFTAQIGRHHPAGVTTEAIDIPLQGRSLAARLYRPIETTHAAKAALPLIVYFHGGGWVQGDLDTIEIVTANLAADAQCAVVSVDYRLAPEYPFPAPCDDAIDAVLWLAEQRARLGLSTDALGVAGDSAGAHLAAIAARFANARVPALVTAQLLLYPVTRMGFDSASYERNAQQHALTREQMKWFWNAFIGAAKIADDDVRVNLMATPPERAPAAAVIVAAYHDPLYDDALDYARYLEQHGAAVTLLDALDMTHSFARLQFRVPAARAWMVKAASATGALLRGADA